MDTDTSKTLSSSVETMVFIKHLTQMEIETYVKSLANRWTKRVLMPFKDWERLSWKELKVTIPMLWAYHYVSSQLH